MSNYSHENGGTWYKGTRPKPVHYCNRPDFQLRDVDVEPGDRWQCGECGQVWEVESKSDAYAYDSPQGGWNIRFKKVYAPGVENDSRRDLPPPTFSRGKTPPYTDHAEWEIR